MAQQVKNPPAMQETQVQSMSWEDPLEKGMATHSSILTWRIPWTEAPGGLQSMGSHRVGHDQSNWAHHTEIIRFMKKKIRTMQWASTMALTVWYQCNSKQFLKMKQEIRKFPTKQLKPSNEHFPASDCLSKNGKKARHSQQELSWERTVRVFFFPIIFVSLPQNGHNLQHHWCHLEFLHHSRASRWERGAIVCAFLSRFEDFSRDSISSRCLVVFHLLDGSPHLIKSWRDFEIATDWECGMELKTLPLIK